MGNLADNTAADGVGQTHLWFMAESPAGPVFVAHCEGRVTGLMIARHSDDPGAFAEYMVEEVGAPAIEPDPDPDASLVSVVNEALAAGRTDVPVDLSLCPPFHQEALAAAAQIPRGEVRTYGELAAMAGSPKAARAAGTAMARNPVPLLVPCHRVVPGSGGVGKYGIGRRGYDSELKRELLANEGVIIN